MTFFELREAALNFAPLSVAAAVVAEAEERQGEEEENKRFAYRRYRRSADCRIFIVIGISPTFDSAFPGRPPYRLSVIIGTIDISRSRMEAIGGLYSTTYLSIGNRVVRSTPDALERLIAPRSGRRRPVIGGRDGHATHHP